MIEIKEVSRDELIEHLLSKEKKITDLGFISFNHFNKHKFEVTSGLQKFGGSFAEALGNTLLVADMDNSIKILRYWAQECEQHALLYQIYEAKRKAEANS